MEENRRSLRCAIYTRKSTEEGLEQQFNSLQAQREAAEAYIRSQQLSGWIALPDVFDDGGFTGANMDRPALKQLLAAIEGRRVDCVVVYKVDRLSRSLLDFARLMALFDRYGISFVSVTQEFNTTTSLGRLTLNILLSFAQFEREIISERTRDKLSAARRKGKWIGGIPVLGYDVDLRGGRLVVNHKEVEQVKEIFAICDKAGMLSASLQEVNAQGLRTKCWTSRGGREHSGKPFCKSSLGALLRNVLYKGCISHKGTIYPGEQQAIVDTRLWERVNRKLELRSASQVSREHQKTGSSSPESHPMRRMRNNARRNPHQKTSEAPQLLPLPKSKASRSLQAAAGRNGRPRCLDDAAVRGRARGQHQYTGDAAVDCADYLCRKDAPGRNHPSRWIAYRV